MANVRPLVLAWIALTVLTAGCATHPVVKGALIGGASGAALGAGTGALISDEDLLGSSSSPQTGNLALQPGSTIAASTLIGAFFGTLVGAMAGHAYDDDLEAPTAPSEAPAAQAGELKPAAF